MVWIYSKLLFLDNVCVNLACEEINTNTPLNMYIGIMWKIYHPSFNEDSLLILFSFGLSCWDLPNHGANGLYIYNNFVMFFKWRSSIRIFNQVWKYSKYGNIKKSSALFHVVCNYRKKWNLFFENRFYGWFSSRNKEFVMILCFSKYFCKLVKLCPKNHYMWPPQCPWYCWGCMEVVLECIKQCCSVFTFQENLQL